MNRPCLEPGCPNLADYRGRCKAHARVRERETHNKDRKRIYSSKKWRLTRRKLMGICVDCGQRVGEHLDHIIPLEEGGEIWDPTNLQPLCHACHSKKTRREMGREGPPE